MGLVFLFLGAFVLAAAVLGYVLVTVARAPSWSLRDTGPKGENARRVVFVGASIVHGTISASIVDELRRRLGPGWEVVNAGRNGELAWNVLQRVDDVVRCTPDEVVVLVGSNDVMASLGPREERRYRRTMALPERPTLAWYRESLEHIVERLRDRTTAQLTLCSLPFLGEDLDSDVNAKVRRYNEVVRDVAERNHVGFVDVYALLAPSLAKAGARRGFPRGLGTMLGSAVAHALLGWSFDRIGRRNGFVVLSDGIHLGETAAGIVAAQLERRLCGEPGRGEPGSTSSTCHGKAIASR